MCLNLGHNFSLTMRKQFSVMAIILHLDDVMKSRGITVTALAEKVGITRVNMSNLKTGNVKAIRFSTLEKICETLECQPADIMEYVPNNSD